MRPRARRPSGRLLPALEAALCALLVVAAAGVAYLPTHDGPQHVFTAHAAGHLDAPGAGWRHWLEPNLPATNHGFTAVFAPLDAWLPWPTALRASLGLMVLLWAFGAFTLARAAHPERAWLGLALAAAALQWTLWMGLFSFYIATAFGLPLLALALRARPWTGTTRLLLGALLLAQALMHVVPAVLTGAMLALVAGLRAGRGERLRALAGVACIGAPAAGVALLLASAGLDVLGDYNEAADAAAGPVATPWWALGKCFASGPAWRAWPLSLLAIFALPLGAARWRRLGAEERALWLGGGALLIAAWLAPLHIRAWDFFSVRFLPLAVCALVVTLPMERLPAPGRRAAAAALALFALAATGWAGAHGRRLAEASAPALAGLAAPLSRDGARLPIVLDPYLGRPFDDARAAVPYAVPLLNLGALYALAQGGVVPYSFTSNPHLHSVLMREAPPPAVDRRFAIDLADPRLADTGRRRATLAYVAGRATGYQDVILWGRESDVEQLLALGFDADYREGGLAIAHFEGCPLEIRLPPTPVTDDTAVLELGWYPAWHATHRYTLARVPPGPDGGRRLRLRQSCGAVWLGFAGGDIACDGAAADGRLVVPAPRDGSEIVCRAQPRRHLARRP